MDSHELDKAATYAINALPTSESVEFEDTMSDALADEVASFRRVAVALTEGMPDIVPAADPGLWDAIARRAGITADPAPSSVASTQRSPWFLMAAAVFLAVVAAGAITLLARSDTAGDLRSLAAAAMTESGSVTVTLENPDGISAIQPEVVIAADGTGYIIADSLPRLRPDHTYQLWVIVDDRVISAGLLGNEPDVVQFRAEGNIAGIAVSNEIAGGVVVSEVPPTAVWLSESA